MMLSRFYYRNVAPPAHFIVTILIIAFINCVTSRSINPDNLTIDKSDVPARYVFEIDEVEDELAEIKKSSPTGEEYANSSLAFNMPIAVAVFSAVLLLVCCFCCLRCAVTYDGIKRSGTYGRSELKS